MIVKFNYLAKFGKGSYLSGFPMHPQLDSKYRAIRFDSREELMKSVEIFMKIHTRSFQYKFKIIEEITIES